ncbi:MAG TPA: histidinol-phosphate transaminase [Acidimicrobiia bacterium]|nr:histidinol-phosphate transaminase [Acidimicrobiia bacterium]
MPRVRSDIAAIRPYQVGRQLADVARAHGLAPGDIVKLTANEGPEGPFPGVEEEISRVIAGTNRYPDNDCWDLGHALAAEMGVDFANLMFGAGSVALLTDTAIAMGGPGTNFVYGWPSFVMYRFVALWAGSDQREIPLDGSYALDLDAMRGAIDDDTTMVLICNPNNPTGTIKSGDEIEEFIDSIPEEVLVVVDEAYHELVTDPAYRTQTPLALERPNVVVLRTFSKIYALAALRVGYAVATTDLLTELRKAQAPLTVNQVAQVAAKASLGQPEELERRRSLNEARRHHLMGALAERGLPTAESHTNFIYFELGERSADVIETMTTRGVLIRGMGGGWIRVTIGTEEENRRFLDALDEALAEV